MIEILFLINNPEEEQMEKCFLQSACNITKCCISNGEQQMKYQELVTAMMSKTYHFVFSINFDEVVARAAYSSGTKNVVWQCESSGASLCSGCIKYPTNYIMTEDVLLSTQFRGIGIETIYYMAPDITLEKIMDISFTAKELQIYDTILELERFRVQTTSESIPSQDKVEKSYLKIISEKEFLISLKEQLMEQIDELLSSKSSRGWEEIIVWYTRNGTKEITKRFWELYILDKMIGVYIEERSRFYRMKQAISMVQFGSMAELTKSYFEMIFLLRRVEYDIEPETHMEVVRYIKERGLSDAWVACIYKNAQIENKEKVEKKLRELWDNYDNE